MSKGRRAAREEKLDFERMTDEERRRYLARTNYFRMENSDDSNKTLPAKSVPAKSVPYDSAKHGVGTTYGIINFTGGRLYRIPPPRKTLGKSPSDSHLRSTPIDEVSAEVTAAQAAAAANFATQRAVKTRVRSSSGERYRKYTQCEEISLDSKRCSDESDDVLQQGCNIKEERAARSRAKSKSAEKKRRRSERQCEATGIIHGPLTKENVNSPDRIANTLERPLRKSDLVGLGPISPNRPSKSVQNLPDFSHPDIPKDISQFCQEIIGNIGNPYSTDEQFSGTEPSTEIDEPYYSEPPTEFEEPYYSEPPTEIDEPYYSEPPIESDEPIYSEPPIETDAASDYLYQAEPILGAHASDGNGMNLRPHGSRVKLGVSGLMASQANKRHRDPVVKFKTSSTLPRKFLAADREAAEQRFYSYGNPYAESHVKPCIVPTCRKYILETGRKEVNIIQLLRENVKDFSSICNEADVRRRLMYLLTHKEAFLTGVVHPGLLQRLDLITLVVCCFDPEYARNVSIMDYYGKDLPPDEGSNTQYCQSYNRRMSGDRRTMNNSFDDRFDESVTVDQENYLTDVITRLIVDNQQMFGEPPPRTGFQSMTLGRSHRPTVAPDEGKHAPLFTTIPEMSIPEMTIPEHLPEIERKNDKTHTTGRKKRVSAPNKMYMQGQGYSNQPKASKANRVPDPTSNTSYDRSLPRSFGSLVTQPIYPGSYGGYDYNTGGTGLPPPSPTKHYPSKSDNTLPGSIVRKKKIPRPSELPIPPVRSMSPPLLEYPLEYDNYPPISPPTPPPEEFSPMKEIGKMTSLFSPRRMISLLQQDNKEDKATNSAEEKKKSKGPFSYLSKVKLSPTKGFSCDRRMNQGSDESTLSEGSSGTTVIGATRGVLDSTLGAVGGSYESASYNEPVTPPRNPNLPKSPVRSPVPGSPPCLSPGYELPYHNFANYSMPDWQHLVALRLINDGRNPDGTRKSPMLNNTGNIRCAIDTLVEAGLVPRPLVRGVQAPLPPDDDQLTEIDYRLARISTLSLVYDGSASEQSTPRVKKAKVKSPMKSLSGANRSTQC